MRRCPARTALVLAFAALAGGWVMFQVSDWRCEAYSRSSPPGIAVDDCFTTSVVLSSLLGVLLYIISSVFGLAGFGLWVFGTMRGEKVDNSILKI